MQERIFYDGLQDNLQGHQLADFLMVYLQVKIKRVPITVFLNLRVCHQMLNLMLYRDNNLPAAGRKPVHSAKHRRKPSNIRVPCLIGFPDDIFQCIIQKMRIDLRYQHF